MNAELNGTARQRSARIVIVGGGVAGLSTAVRLAQSGFPVTVQAMHLEEIQAGQVPQPTVVDHEQEMERVENLISIFPGRATLWPHLADQACAVVRAKLGTRAREIAQPPWGSSCGSAITPREHQRPTPSSRPPVNS